MESEPPLFQILVNDRGWREYEVFIQRFVKAARQLAELEGPASIATITIERRQFYRWMHGELRSAPRREASRVLTFMFQLPVERLFAPAPTSSRSLRNEQVESSSASDWYEHDAEDLVTAAAQESARFAVRAESSNVGPHTMEQLESDIRRIVTTYPNRPVGPAFREVRELRNRAFELLEGRQPPQYTRDLYVAAGVLCGVLANASFDLGRYEAAETQARTAFMCGELAGHNGLRAWVRGLQALISYWEGRPRDAVRLSESGSAFTPEHGTAHIRLASIRARAHGQLQQANDALTALHGADALRDQLTSEDDLPGGMMAFPQEKQLFYASSTHLWLGGGQHLADAEVRAEQAVNMFEAAPADQRRLGEMSLARMDLATARLNRGDLDGAAAQIHDVLAVSARRGTESVRRRLGQFARTLAQSPAAGSPAAIGMHEAIAAHHEHSRAELAPGGTP
ncbi:hypothetical protein [Wenjunlia tyrosinilytica]|uniref:Tetratricopeptide repeat protein n=1 Tax=Wenjunlia tyrosinilytica TaxID=1544741 RepID=A0A917ZX95_9ACTN|nr:hypothetical protein [Wenjunlia tyrosinilytica]GGO99226.1 hypothetical protein GCM10012280_65190 [Wenjunlia tyrosinilytica]